MRTVTYWINRFNANTELAAPDDERGQLNWAIATIASDGCKMYIGDDAHINRQMQKAAKKMMHFARRTDTEPLQHLKRICDDWNGLDVYPESFLVVAGYTWRNDHGNTTRHATSR